MAFHSLDYALFLLLALVVYWALRRTHALRLVFVALASCAFYMAWKPEYVFLILTPTVVDYVAGLGMTHTERPGLRRAFLAASVVANLGLLCAFKYFNWFSASSVELLGFLGVRAEPRLLDVVLPAGISFYTFEALSYTIDVYRRKIPAERNFVRFVCFITFFPKLVAGPIVRGAELLPQLHGTPVLTREKVGRALFLITNGLLLKAAGDFLALNLIDRVFVDPERYTGAEVVIALYAFTLQIYWDFAGYTDVARGSALLFGIELPENFDRPYQSTNPAEFWRRWHMTLSSWLRDYLYFPLGGSRVPPVRAYFNLWLTVFLVGIWHGASWNFVIYGAIHATAMVMHRLLHRATGRAKDAVDPWIVRALKIAAMLQLIVFSRILFRAQTLHEANAICEQIVTGGLSLAQISAPIWILLVVGYAAHWTPRAWIDRAEETWERVPAPAAAVVLAAAIAGAIYVASLGSVPYIYFQF